MIVQDNEELDLSLSSRVDDFDYIIFVTAAKTKYFGCKKNQDIWFTTTQKRATLRKGMIVPIQAWVKLVWIYGVQVHSVNTVVRQKWLLAMIHPE